MKLARTATFSAFVGEVAGLKVNFCSEECRKKVVGAKAIDRLNLVFADEAFARAFVVTVEQKK